MKLVAALLLCLVSAGSQAQTIYRCGNEYTRIPCPQGKIVEATDPRTGAQRAEAVRVATEDRRRAGEMRRERLADQAALKPASAASLSAAPAPPARPASAAQRHPPKKKRSVSKPASSTPFTAADPASRKRGKRSTP